MIGVHIPAGGEWRPDRGVLRWTPGAEPKRDPSDLIACPSCHAKLDEQCKTTTGRHRAPHSTRLVSRRCTCGGRVLAGKKVCEPCRAQARRENARVGMRNTRARRRDEAA